MWRQRGFRVETTVGIDLTNQKRKKFDRWQQERRK
jgi:hypothetical protein